MILFGSYATDKFTDDSDIDIAVFSNLFSDNPISNVDLIANAWIQFPLLDIKTFHTSDFERDSLILEEVKKNGIEINILN